MQNADKKITLRVSNTEKETLTQAAAAAGFASLNPYLLSKIREDKRLSTPAPGVEKASDRSRTAMVKARITPREKQLLRQASEREGLTESAFLRRQLRILLTQEPCFSGAEVEVLEGSKEQLRRIGNNLNQVTKRVRGTKQGTVTVNSSLLEALLAEVHTHKRLVYALLENNHERAYGCKGQAKTL